MTEPIEYIGNRFLWECDQLLAAVDNNYNNDEMIQWLMQRHANVPFDRACSSIAVNSERLQGCFEERGIERAAEVDNQQRTALHILCANPHVTVDSIRT